MPILMYHRVADDGPASLARWRVSPPDFERQIAWLATEGYKSVRLDQWLDTERRDPAALRRRVVLTFDDAYADFVSTAFPVLQRHRFGSTMFVPTGYMGGFADWDRDFGTPAPLMTWDDLGRLAKAGVEIGAHTITHPRLTRLKDEAVAHEIRESRVELERRLGLTVPTFAYPYGDYNDSVEKAVEAAGLSVAVTVDGESHGPLALGRIGIYGDEPFEVFVEKMTAAPK